MLLDDQLEEVAIYINDGSALTPLEIRAQAQRLKRGQQVGMVMVDYPQLMTKSGASSREREIAEISRSLKALAKDCRCRWWP